MTYWIKQVCNSLGDPEHSEVSPKELQQRFWVNSMPLRTTDPISLKPFFIGDFIPILTPQVILRRFAPLDDLGSGFRPAFV